jgi:hypothetical protein
VEVVLSFAVTAGAIVMILAMLRSMRAARAGTEFARLLAAQLEQSRRAVRPMVLGWLVLFAALIALGFLEDSSFQIFTAVIGLAFMGALSAFQRVRLRKLQQSAAASVAQS